MRQSPLHARLNIAIGFAPAGKPSLGLAWGAAAGGVIGAGISVNIGLFYSSADAMACAVIAISMLMGAVFGHVMSHLLSDVDVSFLGRAPGGEHHRILGARVSMADLADHRALRLQGMRQGMETASSARS